MSCWLVLLAGPGDLRMDSLESSGCLVVELEMTESGSAGVGAGVGAVVAESAVETVAAELEFVAAAVDFGCSARQDTAAPIPECEKGDCPLRCLQIPEGPWVVGSLPVAILVTWSAQSASAPVESFPGESFPPLVSCDPLRLWRVTNSAWSRPDPSIAKEVRASKLKTVEQQNALDLAEAD